MEFIREKWEIVFVFMDVFEMIWGKNYGFIVEWTFCYI